MFFSIHVTPCAGIGRRGTSKVRSLAKDGFVVKTLGHVSKEGETFEAQGYVFEVLDRDRHRVDKVLVLPSKSATPPKA